MAHEQPVFFMSSLWRRSTVAFRLSLGDMRTSFGHKLENLKKIKFGCFFLFFYFQLGSSTGSRSPNDNKGEEERKQHKIKLCLHVCMSSYGGLTGEVHYVYLGSLRRLAIIFQASPTITV